MSIFDSTLAQACGTLVYYGTLVKNYWSKVPQVLCKVRLSLIYRIGSRSSTPILDILPSPRPQAGLPKNRFVRSTKFGRYFQLLPFPQKGDLKLRNKWPLIIVISNCCFHVHSIDVPYFWFHIEVLKPS